MPTEPETPRRWDMARAFIGHLRPLLDYGGVRSELRTALRKDGSRSYQARRHLLAWLDDKGARYGELAEGERTQQALLLAAGLMAAFHKAPTLEERWKAYDRRSPGGTDSEEQGRERRHPRLDLGLALAEADRGDPKHKALPGTAKPDKMSPREKRLVQLCRTDADRLPRHLFSTLSFLDGGHHRLPAWGQMAADIEWHTRDADAVAHKWQTSYLTTPVWHRRP
ncbi:type I-E CRISPR-associated protein Cse2/CasB [Nocardiopsis sp. CNT-189]|uniref:type I-E CRISPR-associated protein Cse2/CasB n=1 Tax=Nocardiopsis oceanisediminis TaxID=2816862 RepID=UPI003B2C2869